MTIRLAFFAILLNTAFSIFPAKADDPAILKSDSLYRASEYQAAIVLLQHRLIVAQSKKEVLLQIAIYNSLGKNFSQLGKPVEALNNYQTAIHLADNQNERQLTGKIYKNIGALHEEQKNFSQALVYYKKAEDIAIEFKDESLLADCFNNKGIVYEQQLSYQQALSVYQKALKIYKHLNKEDRIALTLNNIGIVYKYQKRYLQAIDYYNRSMQYSKKLGDRFFVAATLNNMGNVYALLHDYSKAIEHNAQSLKIAQSINATNIIVEAYGSLAEAYAGSGDFKKAFDLRGKYIVVNSEYINLERSNQLAEKQTLYETEKKEHQINSLKQVQQLSSLKNAKQQLVIQQREYQIVFIVGLMLFLGVFAYFFYKKQHQKEVENTQRAIVDAENKERVRIAKDVHDDIGSGLSKITLMAQLANNRMRASGIAGLEINNISQISKDLVENMRDLIWVLNPENSTLDNLIARIREYCSDYLEGLEVAADFDIQDEVPYLKISQQAQRNIFLTIKEALHNCIKHADCRKISIRLSFIDSLLSINIADSGNGFGLNELSRKGNGLRNMQQRIESIGGKFQINSTPGTGTNVQTDIFFKQIEVSVS
ncbi:MAG: hypothetical protein JWQ25_1585 [Daejeonella sp.]|nr:hypothetical protein [Daejeonella sp.]